MWWITIGNYTINMANVAYIRHEAVDCLVLYFTAPESEWADTGAGDVSGTLCLCLLGDDALKLLTALGPLTRQETAP